LQRLLVLGAARIARALARRRRRCDRGRVRVPPEASMRFGYGALCALTIVGLAPAATQAQQRQTRFDTPAYGTEWSVTPQYQPSPENFTLELRVGAYTPADLGAPYYITFGGSLGPMIGAEIDGHIVRVPYLGPIVVGVAFGWANWSSAASSPGAPT